MNCEWCGCLLPEEYHPHCKQCGGPRKAARDDSPDSTDDSTYYSQVAWFDYSPYRETGEYCYYGPLIDRSCEAIWERYAALIRRGEY